MKKYRLLNSIYLKLIISLGLMALIISKIDLTSLKENLFSANINLYFFATILFFTQQVIIAYSWQILLKAQGNNVPFLNVLRVYFIGSFFGAFLPSSVGMDIVRIYGLAKHLKDGTDSASSMVVARVLGFWILIAFALLAAIPMSHILGKRQLFIWILILSIIFLGATIFFLSPFTKKILYLLLKLMHLSHFEKQVEETYRSIYEFSRHRKAIFQLLLVSVLFQILGIYIIFLIGKSLDIKMSIGLYFLLIPIIMIITLIPISIAGIGVRESSFVYFFTQAGSTSAQALSLSLLVFFQWILIALIGGIIYLFQGIGAVEVHE